MNNGLLASLPAAEFDTLAVDLELVPMLLGEMLYEAGQPLRHAYFPTTSVVSLHYVTESGASAETSAVVGDNAVARGEQRAFLALPRVSIERVTVDQHDRLAASVVLVMDLDRG